MRSALLTGLVLGLGLSVAPPAANAKTLRTGALRGPSGYWAVCTVVNAGSKPLKATTTMRVRASGGGTLAGPVGVTGLLPGQGSVLSAVFAATTNAYCEVDGKVSDKDVRITLCLTASSAGPCEAAVEN